MEKAPVFTSHTKEQCLLFKSFVSRKIYTIRKLQHFSTKGYQDMGEGEGAIG